MTRARVAHPLVAVLFSCWVAVLALAACSTTTTVREVSTEAAVDPTDLAVPSSCGTCAAGVCNHGECQCTQDSDCGPNKVCGQDPTGNVCR